VRLSVLVVLHDLLMAQEIRLISESTVQCLRREGEEGREEHLERIHHAQRHVRPGGGPFRRQLQGLPGRCRIQIAVGLARDGHGLADGRAEPAGLDLRADLSKGGLAQREDAPVLRRERTGRWHSPAIVPVREGQHPMRQVAPGAHQLVIVAIQKVLPVEVRVR